MRTRRDIEREYKDTGTKQLEVLLDIRDLLVKANKKPRKKKEAKSA